MSFDNSAINFDILKRNAYNLRWATVEDGVIPLTAADLDFPCAPEIADAITSFAKKRYMCYGPPDGLMDFKESLSSYYSRKRSFTIAPEQIFPVDSAAFGIYLTCKAFLQPDDEALIFDPVDFLFRYSIEAVGAKAVPFAIPAGTSAIDFDKLESLITSKTRMLCLCNPLNPTGKVFTKEELLKIGEIANKHNLIILSDEIWSDIVFEPFVFTNIASISPEISDRTVTITGFSKSYGLAGLRIGAVSTTNNNHYKKLFAASLHGSTVHGANVISQVAAAAALNHCDYWLADFVSHLQKMRDLVVSRLNAIQGFNCIAPQGCYVAFANIKSTGKTSQEMQDLLLQTAKVLVVPGLPQWFGDGAEGYIRLSFATSEAVLTQALDRISSVIKQG